MNTAARAVVESKDPPLIKIEGDDLCREFLGGDPVFTRLWMGLYGGEEADPTYACVLSELYDEDLAPKLRTYIMLDEGIAMDPLGNQYPTMHDGVQAAIALKDIYRIGRCFTSPKQEAFHDHVRRTYGLTYYGRDDDALQLKKWFPHFTGRKRICPVSTAPYGDDEQYCLSTMNALFDRKKLFVMERCERFDSSLQTPRKALALVVSAMQQWPWTWHLKQIRVQDGYEDVLPEDPDEVTRAGMAFSADFDLGEPEEQRHKDIISVFGR